MNNKLLLLSANFKNLLSKEDMIIDSLKLLQDKSYATGILKKAMTSENPNILNVASELKKELGIVFEDNVQETISDAQRLQKLKEKYKKDSSRS